MTLQTPQPKSPKSSDSGPAWPGLSPKDAWEIREAKSRRWIWLAVMLSLGLHTFVYLSFREDFLGIHDLKERAQEAQEEPFEMLIEELVPEEEKAFIQTNPEVPENEPDKAPFVSNRDQQAAQENPVPQSDDPLPTVAGEEATNNIVETTLDEPIPPSPMVQAIPETGQPAPETNPTQAQQVVAQGGGAPQVRESTEDPSVQEPVQNPDSANPSPAQPEVQPSQALNPITALSPPPDFMQGEPDPEATGDGLGLTPVEPAQDSTPFSAQVKTRVISTVRPSQPNFRVVTKAPQVIQPVRSETPRPAEQSGDTDQKAEEATPADQPQPVVQSGTPGQEQRMPRPRPQILPQATPGPLMDNRQMFAGREGSVAVDAEFSTFGDYSARFIEVVYNSWVRTLQSIQMRVGDSGTRVTIRFDLHNDGSVKKMNTVQYSSSELLMNICRDAIKSRDPYEPWPQDMIDLFGESKTLTITFHYR